MPKSNYLANAVTEHIFGGTAFTQPSSYYVAIFSSDPGLDGTGASELVARQEVTSWTITDNLAESDNELLFDAVGSALSVSHYALFDAATGGNCLYTGALNSAVSLSAGDRLKINAADIDLSEV